MRASSIDDARIFYSFPSFLGKTPPTLINVHFKPSFAHIEITSIDVTDQTYVLGPVRHVPPESGLVESIRQYGILRPPVIKSKKDTYLIVSGKKRILAAQCIAAREKLPCLVIPPEAPELYAYTLLLEESLAGKPMSLIQQADFFKKIIQFSQVDDVLPLLAKLGLKPQKYFLDQLLSLLSLSKEALSAVHHGEIRQKTARKMIKMADADQKVIVQLIHSLNLGSSKQQKLVDYCIELIMRTDLPLSTLLRAFAGVDNSDKNQNIPQQAAALLSWLHKQCYPRTEKAELEFRQFTAKLRMPTNMHVTHSPSFENDEVVLSINFTDKDSLESSLPDIIRTSNRIKENN